jgi:PAS domain S-box-containing protein
MKSGSRVLDTAATGSGTESSAFSRACEREQWLELLFIHAADSIFVCGTDGFFLDVNPAGCELLGYNREELITMSFCDVVTGASCAEILALWQNLQANTPIRMERIFRHKDGSLRSAEYGLTLVKCGGRDLILITARDVTEGKRLEERLRESEANLAEGQRLTHTGSWAWDPIANRSFWSAEMFHILGYDKNRPEPSHQEVLKRIHPDDREAADRSIQQVLRNPKPLRQSFRIVAPDGMTKYVESVSHPITNEEGLAIKLVGTLIDVTDRKKNEDAVRASEQVARGQVEALIQSLDVLATAPAPDKFIGQMLSTIGRLLNGQSVALWLRDESTDSLVLRVAVEGPNPVPADLEHPYIKNPLLWKEDPTLQEMFFTGAPIVCEDIEHDPRVSSDVREYCRSKGTKKSLSVPTLVGGHVKGLISIRHGARPPYRPEEIELAQALAHQAMLAIQLTESAEQSRQAAVLEERNRMARDIHDTLAQGFTGVIIQLEAAEDAILGGHEKEADKHLHRAADLARQSLREARRSVRALRPQALADKTLWDALKAIIKNTTVGTALHTEFQLRGKQRELSQILQENLLHIGEEALTNTIKHAHASRFDTRLSFNAKKVRLELRDNGDGFKAEDQHDGFGLAGMRERVEQIGGTLRITSSRGKGTKIIVVSPYSQPALL